MTDDGMSSLDYEAEALRLRARIDDTIGKLRANLEPSRLVDEMAEAVGLGAIPTGAAIAASVRRHPIPAAAVVLGVGLLAYSTFARRRAKGPATGAASSLPRISSSLAQSAAAVVQERGEARRREFVNGARARIVGGATDIADRIDEEIEDLTDGLREGGIIRPLLQSAIELVLSAGLEAVAARFDR